jgi:hypothetical protein
MGMTIDCISRQEVLDLIADYDLSMGQVVRGIHALPSVTPQEPKTGHWITRPHIYGVAFCSECGFELRIDNTNYCPNCGADMREVEE